MMTHRYKQYSHEQLQTEFEVLQKKLEVAAQLGRRSHVAVNRRKIEIVQSYMLLPSDFRPGEVYELKEELDAFFKIDEVNGVVAWGYRIDKQGQYINNTRSAVLIALIGDRVENYCAL
jgi:hypothetical protein